MNQSFRTPVIILLISEILFCTSCTPDPPIVETKGVSDITQTSAVSGGVVKNDGGAEVTARGVCWSNTENPPTISSSKTSDGTGNGSFSSNITGLLANTKYYVCAYATNSEGTGYGMVLNFTTNGNPPLAGYSASPTTVTAGQNVQFTDQSTNTPTSWSWNFGDGGTSTLQNPSHIYSSAGNYSVSLTAINSFGSDLESKSNYITVLPQVISDIDGNVYGTVTIGTQVWMTKNLKTTKLKNGSILPLISDQTSWSNQASPAYCWFNNDATTYGNPYGVLYNWYTVNTGNLCPVGWHVPSDSEWTILTDFLGGLNVAGGKLKETGTTHWISPNTGATNESGFTGLPGGYRNYDGQFYHMGYSGNWWSSTENDSVLAWHRSMGWDYSNADRYYFDKKDGFSVRCIKD